MYHCPRCDRDVTLKPGTVFQCPRFKNWSSENDCLVIEFWYSLTVVDKMQDRDPLLVERQATHGSFKSNACISQELKGVFGRAGYPNNAEQVEALHMIALKLSRILSGQANYKDHWDDIAGYAKLASEACDDTRKST